MQDKSNFLVNDYIKNEPLDEINMDKTLKLVHKFHHSFPNKTIWLYTNYTWEELTKNLPRIHFLDYLILEEYENKNRFTNEEYNSWQRFNILKYIDVLVNQRVINVQKSLKENKIILHCD